FQTSESERDKQRMLPSTGTMIDQAVLKQDEQAGACSKASRAKLLRHLQAEQGTSYGRLTY
ncbi:MAG: hypothetical protein DSZ23_05850, partial [Thermodesulfatator sp.]